MRSSIFAATLALAAGVVARPQEVPSTKNAPSLPVKVYEDTPNIVEPVPFEVAAAIIQNATDAEVQRIKDTITKVEGAVNKIVKPRQSQQCSNVRTRIEWDSYSDSDRAAFTGAIRCLMGRGQSGQFGQARSRYEDLVALHQQLTNNVHGNNKFLIWHRYYLWTFEDILRSECGFDRALPWWDETRYAGAFPASSVFSSQWFGSVNVGGQCVTDGAFANLAINVGPGTGNTPHCLARNNDDSRTRNCNQAYVDQCNSAGDYPSMATCAEGGPHAWGHNGIGSVMQDTFASPSDPVFWLHHAFVDRNFRIWQNQNSARVQSISGTDRAGNPLTMDTVVNVMGMRPDVRIRDILDTTGQTLCYRYSY